MRHRRSLGDAIGRTVLAVSLTCLVASTIAQTVHGIADGLRSFSAAAEAPGQSLPSARLHRLAVLI